MDSPYKSLTHFSFPAFNRWTSKHCLHVSASSPAPATDMPPAPAAQLTSDSYIETHPLPNPSSSFTTAYAMLLYNVCYLAFTQAVEIPLSQAGDVLSNLWSVCCSTELGRSAHIPFCPSEWLIIDAADLTKHTRYFRRPRRPVFHSTLRSYSRPLLRLPRHVHARRVHELREQTNIGVRYRKRTSGTCWMMTKQVLLNSPSTSYNISISPYRYHPLFSATSLSICSNTCTRLYHTFFSPHPSWNLFVLRITTRS